MSTTRNNVSTAEERLIADLAATVGQHIRRAEFDAQQATNALIKIRDEAMRDGQCRWCESATHIYSCPASVAASTLVFCDKRAAAEPEAKALPDTRVYDPTSPRCACTFEERDSECVVHPSCAECGEATQRPVDGCSSHSGAL
jgi:hypothetical protein